MKKDQYVKKLSFKKLTVSNLNVQEMQRLVGGLADQTCDPDISTCRHSCGYTYCVDTTCCSGNTREYEMMR